MPGWLDSPIFRVMEKGLDTSTLRQKVLANNVSNVDTPGFKRSDINFEQALSSALGGNQKNLPLKTTLPLHITGSNNNKALEVITDSSSTIRNDGNNVDIEREMANVAENGLYYQALTRTISGQLAQLRTVIQSK